MSMICLTICMCESKLIRNIFLAMFIWPLVDVILNNEYIVLLLPLPSMVPGLLFITLVWNRICCLLPSMTQEVLFVTQYGTRHCVYYLVWYRIFCLQPSMVYELLFINQYGALTYVFPSMVQKYLLKLPDMLNEPMFKSTRMVQELLFKLLSMVHGLLLITY